MFFGPHLMIQRKQRLFVKIHMMDIYQKYLKTLELLQDDGNKTIRNDPDIILSIEGEEELCRLLYYWCYYYRNHEQREIRQG